MQNGSQSMSHASLVHGLWLVGAVCITYTKSGLETTDMVFGITRCSFPLVDGAAGYETRERPDRGLLCTAWAVETHEVN